MRAGDPFGDHGQRAIALAVILEPVFANEDGMGAPAPLTHQRRAGLGPDIGIKGRGAFLKLSARRCKRRRSAGLALPSVRSCS